MNKNTLVNALWRVFLQRLRDDWPADYQRAFGDYRPPNQIDQPSNFARAVHKNATRRFRREGIKTDIVSISTLDKTFQKGAISANSKNHSLNFYAAFAGYKDWDEFRLKEKRRLLEVDAAERGTNSEQDNNTSGPPPATRYPATGILSAPALPVNGSAISPPSAMPEVAPIFVTTPPSTTAWLLKWVMRVIAIFVLLYIPYYCEQRSQIIALIEDANNAEFAAYKAIPQLDTAFFDRCYTERNGYKKEVRDILLGAAKKGHVLRDISHQERLSIFVWVIYWRNAKVTTRENWFIRWEGAQDKRLKRKYDEVNDQDYKVYHDGDRWRIDADAFGGTKVVVEE